MSKKQFFDLTENRTYDDERRILREKFAGQIMAAYLSGNGGEFIEHWATLSVKAADALIAELEKTS